MVAGYRAVAIVKTRRSSPGRWLCTVQGGVQHHDVACQRGTSALGWPSSSQTLRRLTQMLAILSTRTISVTERFGTIISLISMMTCLMRSLKPRAGGWLTFFSSPHGTGAARSTGGGGVADQDHVAAVGARGVRQRGARPAAVAGQAPGRRSRAGPSAVLRLVMANRMRAAEGRQASSMVAGTYRWRRVTPIRTSHPSAGGRERKQEPYVNGVVLCEMWRNASTGGGVYMNSGARCRVPCLRGHGIPIKLIKLGMHQLRLETPRNGGHARNVGAVPPP